MVVGGVGLPEEVVNCREEGEMKGMKRGSDMDDDFKILLRIDF